MRIVINSLKDIDFIAVWPSISVVLFLFIFIFIVFNVIKFDKKKIEEWGAMPLDFNGEISQNTDKTSIS